MGNPVVAAATSTTLGPLNIVIYIIMAGPVPVPTPLPAMNIGVGINGVPPLVNILFMFMPGYNIGCHQVVSIGMGEIPQGGAPTISPLSGMILGPQITTMPIFSVTILLVGLPAKTTLEPGTGNLSSPPIGCLYPFSATVTIELLA